MITIEQVIEKIKNKLDIYQEKLLNNNDYKNCLIFEAKEEILQDILSDLESAQQSQNELIEAFVDFYEKIRDNQYESDKIVIYLDKFFYRYKEWNEIKDK